MIFALHDFDKQKKSRGAFSIPLADAETFNEEGYGIFWTPNKFTGNVRREEKLEKINSWFVDLDGGNKVSHYSRIKNFPLVPTKVVETRNGIHAYYSVKGDVDLKQYKTILARLVNVLDGDQNAKGVTRILRLPGYWHQKDPNRKFLVTLRFSSTQSHTAEEMDLALSKFEDENARQLVERKEARYFSEVGSSTFWTAVHNLDCRRHLPALSNLPECNNEVFEVRPNGEKSQIYVNGELVESCWIDSNGLIGSHGDGGPNLYKWLKWYGIDKGRIAEILKERFPEIVPRININL